MTDLDTHIQAARTAIRQAAPEPPLFFTYVGLNLLLDLGLVLHGPLGILVMVAIHVGAARWVFPRNEEWVIQVWHMLWAPAAALWLLPAARRTRWGLRKTHANLCHLTVTTRDIPLPTYRLIPRGQALDLATGRLVGSWHTGLHDLAQRTPARATGIRALQERCQDGILVSGTWHQVLLSSDGQMLGFQRFFW